MAIRVLGKTRAVTTGDDGDRFVGVREVSVPLAGDLWADEKDDVELLASLSISCQRGGTRRSGLHCLSCERFVHCVATDDGERAVLHCFWDHTDSVSELMTCARALVTVPKTTPVREARELMESCTIGHLPVLSGFDLVGIVADSDLDRAVPEHSISRYMRRAIWIIRADATLSDAAGLMRREGIGALPVVDDGTLCGIITRTDLERAGLPGPLVTGEAHAG